MSKTQFWLTALLSSLTMATMMSGIISGTRWVLVQNGLPFGRVVLWSRGRVRYCSI